jgi:hypothetical protein
VANRVKISANCLFVGVLSPLEIGPKLFILLLEF